MKKSNFQLLLFKEDESILKNSSILLKLERHKSMQVDLFELGSPLVIKKQLFFSHLV
jgi:hypothetical protein